MRSVAAAAARRARAAISIRLSALSRPHSRSLNDDVSFIGKRTRAAHRSALSITTTYLGGLAFSSSPNKPSKEERELTELFESWISKHGRVYKDAEEKQYRFNVFKDKLKFLDAMEKQYGPKHKSPFGLNMFSDRTVAECESGYPAGRLESERLQNYRVYRINEEEPSIKNCSRGVAIRSFTKGVTIRSFIKVFKLGVAFGRSFDLTKFNNYNDLIAEMDRLFEFDGELMAKKNWQPVYTGDKKNWMLVGDDGWSKFCATVSKIMIYPREEVQEVLGMEDQAG